MSPRPSRRAVLRAGVALPLLAGCTLEEPGPPPPPDPDVALRDGALAREQALLDAYDAALLAAPGLTARLAPLRAEHVEHLVALGSGPVTPVSPSPSSSASPSAPAPPPTPADPATVLAGLRQAEGDAAAAHGAAVLEASRELAVVLATLAASEGSHPVALA